MASASVSEDKDLIQCIRKFILSSSQECRADLQDIFQKQKRQLQDYGVENTVQLKEFLCDYPVIFDVHGYGRGKLCSVTLTTQLTLCPEHSRTARSCRSRLCDGLHFCKFYLLSGDCRHRDRCLFGHELGIPHNLRILREHCLDNLTLTDLRAVFTLPSNRHGVLRPQICRYYNIQSGCRKGRDCHSLHLCRPYVDGDCKFGKNCRRNHNITTDTQVDNVLTMYGVSTKRRPHEILEELKIYMTDDGDEEEYTDDDDDINDINDGGVAVRPPYQGKKSKQFGSMPNLFRKQPLSVHNPGNGVAAAPHVQRHPSVGRLRQRTESDNYGNANERRQSHKLKEICLYHLQGTCKFGEKCMRVHTSQKFEWRFTAWGDDGENAVWRSLSSDSNIELERNFCQPDVSECSVKDIDDSVMHVSFKKFTATNSAEEVEYTVQRLSTPSAHDVSIRKNGFKLGSNLVTEWVWYWRDKDRAWHVFEYQDDDIEWTSEQVEKHYMKRGENPHIRFGHYQLSFEKMRLKNLDDNHNFKIQRRPEFSLLQALPVQNSPPSQGRQAARQSADGHPVNPAWSAKLLKSDQEYKEVKAKFSQTLGRAATVIHIHKLENKKLLSNYERQRNAMAARSKKNKVLERELYYCPSSDEEGLSYILQNGISCQPEQAPPREANLGKGAYFYVNAGRADKMFNGGVVHLLFVVDCLVGKQTEGQPNASAKHQTDSLVDDARNPKVFVIANRAQVYAKYAVTFRSE